ncbi:hypothetical protein O2K51_01130 [Apibacter raozihei]|uniref:hypothetical protein n=1 Tax=Apibacter raozihei TaxID=2500547 RepID=UPI000FE2EEF1|nr:hypothetical protein [Apibacter raozihei]
MAKRKTYLAIEEKIFKSLGKTGYTLTFTVLFMIVMCIADFLLYCFLDHYNTSKFIFTGEMNFTDWLHLMVSSYQFSYFKTGLFTLILLLVGNYRSKTLKKEFSE